MPLVLTRHIRLLCILSITVALDGCYRAQLGGATGYALVTLSPLRQPDVVIAEATTLGDADWIELLGETGWEALPASVQHEALGIIPIRPGELDAEALYLLTASGGTDYSPGGDAAVSASPAPVQGQWHAIVTGQQIADGYLHVSALTEASYRQVEPRLQSLSNAEVSEQLDAAARLLLTDVNDDMLVNHADVLAWRRAENVAGFKGDMAELDALAGAVRAAMPTDMMDTYAQGAFGRRRVLIDTSFGDVEVETLNWEAPITVDNFLRYVEDDFYDNIAFHRVIEGFIIQTGVWELLPGGRQVAPKSPRDAIINESEFSASNQRGTLAMARADGADSANAQFFVNQGDNAFLDFGSPSNPEGFTVFARVVAGQEVADSIARLPTDFVLGIGPDAPLQIVLIQSTRVLD